MLKSERIDKNGYQQEAVHTVRVTLDFGIDHIGVHICGNALIPQQGNYRAAIQMDIDDITSKFGTKCNDAIMEMLEYATKMGWW